MAVRTRRGKRRQLKNEINVVPYIDVMLVLLIIFMVTAPLMNLGTDINLPDSNARSLEAPEDPLVISVYADGALALMMEGDNQSVTPDDLLVRLRAINNQNPGAAVLINGDGAASYQQIMRALDAVNEAGITRVSLISRPVEAGR
ncbi:protein TolR [Luteimonas sp. A649]